jgi:hypothetical protein
MDVHDLMRQCDAKTPLTRALVKGLAKELKIDESFLEKLADEVRPDLGAKRGPHPHVKQRYEFADKVLYDQERECSLHIP